MGLLTLADGRTRVDCTLTEPEGYGVGDGELEIALADFGTFIVDATKQINKPDYRLSATGSDTVPDAPLDKEGNATTFSASNYEGTVTILRKLAATGLPDTDDTLYTAVGVKGVRAWWVERIGKKGTVPLAVDDEGWIYEAISDEPQSPTDQAGYIKNVVPLGVQSRRRFKIVAGS